MLMFDGLDGLFRTIRLRGRQPSCPVCGEKPTITHLIDYEQFCGTRADDKVCSHYYKTLIEKISAKVLFS